MQSIENGFKLEDSTIHSGDTGGVFVFMSEGIVLNNLTVYGALEIDLDETQAR